MQIAPIKPNNCNWMKKLVKVLKASKKGEHLLSGKFVHQNGQFLLSSSQVSNRRRGQVLQVEKDLRVFHLLRKLAYNQVH